MTRFRQLGEVLNQVGALELVDWTKTYAMAGVRSFGRGAFAAPDLMGSSTSYSHLRQLRSGMLTYPKLMAWEGAFAVIPGHLDGRYVSPEFVVFTSSDEVNWNYLSHLVSWDGFCAGLLSGSSGTNARRRRLHPDQFLDFLVPLPDLPEQRRIAAYLDEVQAKTQVANGSESAAPSVAGAWLESVFNGLIADTPLGDVSVISRGPTPSFDSSNARIIGQASVRWEGLDDSQFKPVDGEWERAVSADRRTRVGDLLLNSTGEGTIGRACVVEPQYEGFVTDSKVMTIRPGKDLTSDFLALFLRSPQGRRAVNDAKGANTTKQTELGKARAERLLVPVPTKVVQEEHVSAWNALAEPLGRLHSLARTRAAALSALLPAARNEVFSAMR